MSNSYLFIGGAGFVGSNIIRQMLLQQDAPQITVMEPSYADISRLADCDVDIVRGTLKDTELIESVITNRGITRVVHLVSGMTPGSGYDDYIKELQDVVRPTIYLTEVCRRLDAELIYFSSGGAVYGESTDGRPFRESDPLKPISYYGLSKLVIESNIRFEHRTNGLRYLILRPSNPFGRGQRPGGSQGLIAIAIGKILSGQPVTIWGDGSAVRDYICIDDMARAVCSILRSCACNEAINIGSGVGLSVNNIIGYLNDVVSQPVYTQYTHCRKGDVASVVLDTSRMQQICCIPLTNIREGIRAFYNSFQQRT